jgi:hypothetical protein
VDDLRAYHDAKVSAEVANPLEQAIVAIERRCE